MKNPSPARMVAVALAWFLLASGGGARAATQPQPSAAPDSLAPLEDKLPLDSRGEASPPADELDEEPAIPLRDEGISTNGDDTLRAEAPPPPGSPPQANDASPAPSSGGSAATGSRSSGGSKAPPAEFPYPGAREQSFRPPLSIKDDPPAKPNPDLPRPSRITEDGAYIYDSKEATEARSRNPALPAPKASSETGEYNFGQIEQPKLPANRPAELEKPVELTLDGYYYDIPKTSPSGSWSMRFGLMSPPNIANSANQASFSDVYGASARSALLVDYEWRLTRKIGILGLKVGSGVMTATGTGQFVDPSVRSVWNAEEVFTFVLFPNTVTMNYRFQYSDSQLFVPFVEGGAGYYTFMELRDDGLGTKYGGAPVALAAGGFMIGLDKIDPAAIGKLDSEYGISHVFFLLEGRGVVGLHPKYNFTSAVVNAGVVTDF